MDSVSDQQEQHLCSDCYGVNKGFDVNDEGYRVCRVCEGRTLTLQEAADTIANLKMPNTNSPFMGAYDDSDFG